MLKTLSPGLQAMSFILIIILMIFAGDAIYNISVFLVVDKDLLLNANLNDPRVVLSHTFFVQIFSFLIAFMYYMRLTGERFSDLVYIGRIQRKPLLITLAALVIGLLAMPFLEWLNEPLREVLSYSYLEREAATNELQNQLIFTDNKVQFGFVMVVFAMAPAIGEELVFRGFLIKKMLQSGMAENGAIIMSSAIFAIAHMQPLKFLPMFFMGLCLGYVYLRFRNIKYSILLHFLFNGVQITIGYLIASDIIEFSF